MKSISEEDHNFDRSCSAYWAPLPHHNELRTHAFLNLSHKAPIVYSGHTKQYIFL